MQRLPSALLVLIGFAVAPASAQQTFNGSWDTTFGKMTLKQNDDKVTGEYEYEGISTLEGKVAKNRLTFTYKESMASGEGWFEISTDGKSFTGKWRETGTTEWSEWTGTRRRAEAATAAAGFDGLWQTSFGRMRLVQSAAAVDGIYDYAGGSSVKGTVEKNKLTFTYAEPGLKGEGSFELSSDGTSFSGKWKQAGSEKWETWTGKRITPQPGKQWLVVVEANWEQNLAEQEYTFGGMLRAFFLRSANIQVRHRLFTDESSFRRWCQETAYLAEPTVLVVASHGTPKGIPVTGGVIAPKTLGESLRYSSNLKLLHFSACETMKEKLASELQAAAGKQPRFAISGYTTCVDWAASAVIEFMYLDMVLMRGMDPEKAGEQIVKLMPFAGDKKVPDTIMPAAGFRFVKPPSPSTTVGK